MISCCLCEKRVTEFRTLGLLALDLTHLRASTQTAFDFPT